MRRPVVDIYRLGGRLVVCVAALVSFAMVVPAFFTIPVSFSSTRYIIFPPKTLSLRWYEAYLTIPEWTSATGYSVLLACLTMVVTLALGLPAAFGLARGTFPGKKAMTLLFVVPLMIPVILIAMAEYFFLIDLGLVGTTTGLVIAHTVFAMPFVIIIVHATLQGFDRNYELAAMSLGASPATTFWYVTLPLIKPGVLSAALLAFLASFNEFLISLFRHRSGRHDASDPVLEGNSVRIEPDDRRGVVAVHRPEHYDAVAAPARALANPAPRGRRPAVRRRRADYLIHR